MYMEKLSKKESKEIVTKGFLVNYLEQVLESKNYITKDYLESRNYITKDYFEDRLTKQSAEFRQYIESLMEHQVHQLQVLIEQMDDRYVLRREWTGAKGA